MQGRNDSTNLKELLDNGIVFLFTINPTHAYRWAINNNAYTLSAMLKKHEEIIRSERDRGFAEYIKVGTFIMMVLVGLGIMLYLLLHGSGSQIAVPNILPSGGGGSGGYNI